ncbi:hypothetical protein KDN24_18165 [Bacillus sp. Bva_UNVM-123]|uniref:YrvL family regulatory protein n=1 Tax=Bacillus sp. Bva_UNVM-123 TaxID=2829798 RepID=UPI00391F0B74
MAEQSDDSFKNMNMKDKIATVIGITLLMVLVIGFIFGIYLFGFAGIFKLLGVHYQSNWSLAIFVASFYILGLLVDLIFDAFAKLTVEKVKGNVNAFFIQLLFGFASNWLVLFTVDAFMESVTLILETKFIIALLLAVLEPIFDNKKEKIR